MRLLIGIKEKVKRNESEKLLYNILLLYSALLFLNFNNIIEIKTFEYYIMFYRII